MKEGKDSVVYKSINNNSLYIELSYLEGDLSMKMSY